MGQMTEAGRALHQRTGTEGLARGRGCRVPWGLAISSLLLGSSPDEVTLSSARPHSGQRAGRRLERRQSVSCTAGMLQVLKGRPEETSRSKINRDEGCGQDPTGSFGCSTANLQTTNYLSP